MDRGWLQRETKRGATQRIGVRNDGWELVEPGQAPPWPVWFKVSVRRFDEDLAEYAVQGYGDSGYGRQIFYGHAFVPWKNGAPADITVAWDAHTQPVDPPGQVGWPETTTPVFSTLSVAWADLGGMQEVVTYGLEWWWEMLFNFTGGLKTQLDTMGWPQSAGAGYTAPDDVVLVVDDDLKANDIRSKLKDALVVIHGAQEVPSEPAYMGGSGRKGRTYQATITLLARSGKSLSGSQKEDAFLKLAYMAEDLEDRLAPPRNPNLLADWLYFSRLEMVEPVRRADDIAVDGTVARVDFRFTGYKIQLVTEQEAIPAGEGVAFNFNQAFVFTDVADLLNDHDVVYTPATGLYHDIGIIAVRGAGVTGSQYLHHHRGVDLRTWERVADIELGTWVAGNWRAQVWAPDIIMNPGYGQGGALSAYKWLMFFTGANWTTSRVAASQQKIGLAGCVNDDLSSWTVLNGDAPLYWAGLATGTYPAGAPWARYDLDWKRDSRDACVFTDGVDWYLAMYGVADESTAGITYGVIGLAKFAGGTTPDFLTIDHEANPIMTSTTSGSWPLESPVIRKVGTLWHLFKKGQNGTRYHSGATMFGPPWPTTTASGTLLMNQGGYPIEGTSYGEAPGFVQLGGAGSVWALSGHIPNSGGVGLFYFHAFVELDFAAVDVVGEVPTVRPMCGITGLVGWRSGVMDTSLRWSIIDSQGSAGAFYRQPVWGDQAAAAGFDPSGMAGNSYIATKFKHYCIGADMAGQAWPDDTKVGAIQSSSFTITKNRLSLKVGGGNHPTQEFVALCRADDDTILFSETGLDSHTMTTRLWDLTSLAGLEVYLVIVDNATVAWGNISVDDIREYNETGNPRDGAAAPLPNGESVLGLLP